MGKLHRLAKRRWFKELRDSSWYSSSQGSLGVWRVRGPGVSGAETAHRPRVRCPAQGVLPQKEHPRRRKMLRIGF